MLASRAAFWQDGPVPARRLGFAVHGLFVAMLAAGAGTAACHRQEQPGPDPDGGPWLAAASGATIAPPPDDAPKLAATAVQVWIHETASAASRKLGYLRLGAVVARGDKPAGKDGCPGGWYSVYPRGYVCVGDEVTLDVGAPLVRAASVRPDLSKPLPYHYGFVRAVAPQYLKVPDRDEQIASEFALERHLAWWAKDSATANVVVPGANDVALDPAGVALDGAPLPAGQKRSPDLTQGELFGGTGDADPVPFWLQGGRQLPNVSGFEVPEYAVFANRVRRHTGLAFIGDFATGDDSFGRRFAITTDLRLVPTDKVKPDTASPFHGVAIHSIDELPFAWVRTKAGESAHVYRIPSDGTSPEKTGETFERRTIHKLSGKWHRIDGIPYFEMTDGKWLSGNEVGAALVPGEWPAAASAGEKWIDISIENEVLVAWQGKAPVYAALVSAGQDGMGDPLTTKSTIRGTFRIRDKHVTTTMDSNGHASEGEQAAPPKDPQEGKTVRRGQGTFELRDVPWVQYFREGFALHTAYWHDVFGIARSHGCVNLSPIDGHWLFGWTDPQVPPGWHGVETGPDTTPGTTVVVHR
jgi:lipoprotein-anchoring transpeptidase ErfK/SrfK